MAETTCEVCKGPATSDNRVLIGVRGGGGRVWACGVDCRVAHERGILRRQQCAGFECSTSFTPGERGRPPLYCSESCRKATDKALRRAQVLVARGKVPTGEASKVEAAISHVTFLTACWWGKRARVYYGRPFPPVEPAPAPELVIAARQYLQALHDALPGRLDQQRRAKRERRGQEAAKRLAEIKAGKVAEDSAWRRRVLEDEASAAAVAEVEAGVF